MNVFRISLIPRFLGLLGLFFSVFSPLESRAAGEQVDIFTQYGGDIDDWVFANSSGTATNGYTVRIGSFSENQSVVLSLSYNRNWIDSQLQVFGNGTSATQGTTNTAGSFVQTLLNTDDFFKGKQAWVVYSDNANLTASSNFGVVSSSNASYTISNGDPWITTLSGEYLQTSEGGVVGFGSVHATNSTTGTIRVAAAPATNLYWDADHPGLGGTGTWSSTSTNWTTNSSGVANAGQYAWGTTSAGNYTAGDGLTAYFDGTDGTVTVSGTVSTHAGLTFAVGGYNLTAGTIHLAGTNATANTITTTSGTTTISSALSGTHGLVKEGGGTLRLDAANTGLSGNITVEDGTLRANAADAVAVSGTNRTIINSGGSLLISANNAVSGNLTLNGGTIAVSGTTTDTVGALTLSSSSVIDLSNAANARSLYFADSSAISWTGTLSIWNWNGTNLHGTSYGAGDRQIFFGNSASGLTQSQLDNISFYSDSGSSFIGTAFIRSTGEIAAVPEPEVYATALLLLFGAAYHFGRRYKFSHPASPA